MPASLSEIPAFQRIDVAGATRGLFEGSRISTFVARAWDGLRVQQVQTESLDVPEGRLVNHVVTLHLGGDATCELNVEGHGWQAHHTALHSVGVYPALLPYAARTCRPREFLIVEIAPDFVAAVLGRGASHPELRPAIGTQDPFAAHVLLALAEEARTGEGTGAIRAESLGTALAAHLVERDLRQRPLHVSPLPSPKLRRVLDYIAAHLDAPLTLRTLAALAEMDPFRFTRAFKQSTGLSPHRYVLEARIARAKELLRDRGLSITEIALRTGFATPSHFSVTFRRIASVTPRAFRGELP